MVHPPFELLGKFEMSITVCELELEVKTGIGGCRGSAANMMPKTGLSN
jgi:hypothetical protein